MNHILNQTFLQNGTLKTLFCFDQSSSSDFSVFKLKKKLFYVALCNFIYNCIFLFWKAFLNNIQYTENAKIGLFDIIEIPYLFCWTEKSPYFSKQLCFNK